LISHPSFANYNKIIVTDKEAYAANLIKVNDYVIFPLGYPETKDAIEEAGHEVIEVDTSEFKKQDGGLSCLSLRFYFHKLSNIRRKIMDEINENKKKNKKSDRIDTCILMFIIIVIVTILSYVLLAVHYE